MKSLFVRFSLLFGLAVAVSAYRCSVNEYIRGRILNCVGISDGDLPMQLDEFVGHYITMSLQSSKTGINVPEAAFSGVTFDKLQILMGVESIDEKFLTPHQQSNVTHMEFRTFRMKHFPWATVASLTKLE